MTFFKRISAFAAPNATNIVLNSTAFISHNKIHSHSSHNRYSLLTDDDIIKFESIIDNTNGNAILTSDLDSYNTCWLKKYKGRSKLVLKPSTTAEVSGILSYCNNRKLSVNIQSGNTGLVGGSVPVSDEIILNTSRMNRILSFDDISGILTLEAGCILQDVDHYLQDKHMFTFPLDLGAKGSCFIGGNIATNAGGLRLLRFGNLHGNVIGLEVVLADGTILDLMSQVRKDNTGYDLKQLFIGSEGTLGIVTKACILCPKKCASTNVLLVNVHSFADVLSILAIAKTELNEILSAIEFMDDCAISQPLKYLPRAKYPLSERTAFYVLIETNGCNAEHDREKLDKFIETLMDRELITDGCIAEDKKQFDAIWMLREGIAPALNEAQLACYKYDISLPMMRMYDIVQDCKQRIKDRLAVDDGNVDVMGYGHLGDGNLHMNIIASEFKSKYEEILEPWVFEWISDINGSISAEHGIGVHKPQYLHLSKSLEAIEYMKKIKTVFDPNLILNPYKVLPENIALSK